MYLSTPVFGADGRGLTSGEYRAYEQEWAAKGWQVERVTGQGDRIVAVHMRHGPSFFEEFRRARKPWWRR